MEEVRGLEGKYKDVVILSENVIRFVFLLFRKLHSSFKIDLCLGMPLWHFLYLTFSLSDIFFIWHFPLWLFCVSDILFLWNYVELGHFVSHTFFYIFFTFCSFFRYLGSVNGKARQELEINMTSVTNKYKM